MFIQTETTPNPHALKFFPGIALCDSGPSRWMRQRQDLALAPLARDLLTMESVAEVLITRDYVSVRKDEDGDWASLKILILSRIADFVEFGWPALTPEADQDSDIGAQPRDTAEREILDVLDAYVRPAVARDGGDVRLHDYDAASRTVRIELLGACSGCPSARITLKQRIERILTEHLAFVQHVEEFLVPAPDRLGEQRRRLQGMAASGGTSQPPTRFAFNGKAVAGPGG